MDSNFNVGDRVRELRTKHGQSQEQLAFNADITPSYLGQIERNLKSPTVRVIERLCQSLGVSLADFFSTSPTSSDIDPISLQIISQIANRSNEQKQHILGIVREVTKYYDHP